MKIVIVIIIIILLWYIASDCNKTLAKNLSNEAILIFVAFSYFIIMLIFAYYNSHHVRKHFPLLNTDLVVLLILVATITLTSTIIYWHFEMPQFLKNKFIKKK